MLCKFIVECIHNESADGHVFKNLIIGEKYYVFNEVDRGSDELYYTILTEDFMCYNGGFPSTWFKKDIDMTNIARECCEKSIKEELKEQEISFEDLLLELASLKI